MLGYDRLCPPNVLFADAAQLATHAAARDLDDRDAVAIVTVNVGGLVVASEEGKAKPIDPQDSRHKITYLLG
ncbi:MAG TPA: hypothetical protein VGC13_23000 [Longimicrobium sp.]